MSFKRIILYIGIVSGAFWILFVLGDKVFTYFQNGDRGLPRETAQRAEPDKPIVVGGIASSPQVKTPNPLSLISAQSYFVVDIDTGEVYAEKNSSQKLPIASITKLMTALVVTENLNSEEMILIQSVNLMYPQIGSSTESELVSVENLLYPLLMESNNAVAHTIADFYGTREFIVLMNSNAKLLKMNSTTFVDSSGKSAGNVSTARDLSRLVAHIVNKKTIIFEISRTPTYKITAESGNIFAIRNFNVFSYDPHFIGGKVGQTIAAGETMVSVFSVPVKGITKRIAIIVLHSKDYTNDTKLLKQNFGPK